MLTYLVQITLCWGLFALLYSLLLRRETFFRANRAYLLATLALGMGLPLVAAHIPLPEVLPELSGVVLPVVTADGFLAARQQTAWTIAGLMLWVYAAGALFAMVRLFWGIRKLRSMALNGRKEALHNKIAIIRTAEASLPFSFFSWIFVPEDFDTGKRESRYILDHERAHVRGWHSADVLLAELGCIVFWFHPLVHWYRRSLRTVHEYLADAEASGAADRREYGLSLLRQAQPVLAFVNQFFQAPLKQRLLMLTRRASPAVRRWKYALVLPAIGLLVGAFQEHPPSIVNTTFSATELDQQPEYPGGIPALVAYLSENIQYPEDARKARAEGVVVLELTLSKTGKVIATSLTRSTKSPAPRQDMAEEAIRVVQQMPAWKPAQRQGRAVPCRMTLPIRFKLE